MKILAILALKAARALLARAAVVVSLILFPLLSLWLSFRYHDRRARSVFLNIGIAGTWVMCTYVGILCLGPEGWHRALIETLVFLVLHAIGFLVFLGYKSSMASPPDQKAAYQNMPYVA